MKKILILLTMLFMIVCSYATITYATPVYSDNETVYTAYAKTTVAVADTANNYIKSTAIKIPANTDIKVIYIYGVATIALQHTASAAVVRVRPDVYFSNDGTYFFLYRTGYPFIVTGATLGKTFFIALEYATAIPKYIQIRWVGMGSAAKTDYTADIFGEVNTIVTIIKN
jgi:hypothetical protein